MVQPQLPYVQPDLELLCSHKLSCAAEATSWEQMLQIKSQPHKTTAKLHLHPALIYRELLKA